MSEHATSERADDPSLTRIGAFSDGVFAFAITLLVLTIRIPHPTDADASAGLLTLLTQQWRNYLAYVLSFMLVGINWANHRVMFSKFSRNMEGKSAPEIADLLKVHRSKVSLWLQAWRRAGVDGMLEGHRSGRPHNLSEKQRQQLADILDSGPVAYGFTSGVWTCPMVARIIEDEFSVSYHSAHVSRLLHQLEFSVQRPKKLLARADEKLQSRWIRYRYPDVKKKPAARKQRSSLATKLLSGKTRRSIKPGPA